ncbi:MAG: helix-turn-helix domain-containing protein [Bryobacteraceae bacterium]
MQSPNSTSLQIGQPFNPYGRFNGAYIPEPICKYRGLSPGAKLIYGRLCRYAGKEGAAYPAIRTLADETGMSETQARTYIRELEVERFILVDRENRHYHADGGGGSNVYVFLWHEAFLGDLGSARKGPPPLRKTEGVALRETAPPSPAENCTQRESSSRESIKDSHLANAERSYRIGKPESGPLKSDDDEKASQPRAPGESATKEFLFRVSERHPNVDSTPILRDVQAELKTARIPLRSFLERDEKVTTNPRAITNPPGYYRDLAQKMAEEQHSALSSGIPPDLTVVESPRCSKCVGGRVGPGYCVCALGKDLQSVESRASKRASQSAMNAIGTAQVALAPALTVVRN